MSSLFPELESQFEAAAEARAEQPRGLLAAWRRRPWRVTTLALVGAAVMSTGAYATRGFWTPVLGGADEPRVAVRAAPSPETLAQLAVLRREQTEVDRGAAARYALRFPAAQLGVRTSFVRVLGRTPSGAAVVLVPTTNAVPGAAKGAGPDQLCLWVADATVGGGRVCGDLAALRAGEVVLRIEPSVDPAEEADRARQRRQQGSADEGAGSGIVTGRGTPRLLVVGLAPDGATVAELRAPTGPVTEAPIQANLFQVTVSGTATTFQSVAFRP